MADDSALTSNVEDEAAVGVGVEDGRCSELIDRDDSERRGNAQTLGAQYGDSMSRYKKERVSKTGSERSSPARVPINMSARLDT